MSLIPIYLFILIISQIKPNKKCGKKKKADILTVSYLLLLSYLLSLGVLFLTLCSLATHSTYVHTNTLIYSSPTSCFTLHYHCFFNLFQVFRAQLLLHITPTLT